MTRHSFHLVATIAILAVSVGRPNVCGGQGTTESTAAPTWRQHAVPVVIDPGSPTLSDRGKYVDALIGTPSGYTLETAKAAGIGVMVTSHQASYEELPSSKSDAVVIATFISYTVHMTPSRRSLYTLANFRVKDNIKDRSLRLSKNGTFSVLLLGGTGVLPSNEKITYGISQSELPFNLGHRYILFLHFNVKGAFWDPLKAWDLTSGTASPDAIEDRLRQQQGTSAVAGKSEAEIVSTLKSELAR